MSIDDIMIVNMTAPLIHFVAVLLLSGLLMLFGKAKLGLILVHGWVYYIALTINREGLLGSGDLSPSSMGHIVLVAVAAAAVIMTALGLFANKE